ncbi:collagen alpha-1(XII) chain-like [Glandiceps talaboti]
MTLELRSLVPDTTYNITVYAVAGDDPPQRSVGEAIVVTTEAAGPEDIIIKEVTATSIYIMWQSHGKAISYSTSIADSGSSTVLQTRVYSTASGTTEHTFTGLTPGQLYDITLVMTNVNQPDGKTVSQRTYPLAPTAIYLGQITATSIALAWDAASTGVVDGYELTYFPSEGVPASPVTFAADDELQLIITNLRPETTFNIFIVTIAGTGDDQMVHWIH